MFIIAPGNPGCKDRFHRQRELRPSLEHWMAGGIPEIVVISGVAGWPMVESNTPDRG
ncbi:hypothetical protein ASZ90_014839 [hydrocarbon metagenome]|uniref:Uncharacterized protein n=1 Tax=hydrocarbon metagenome TaxID=938273 RepID=A0A0W8F3L9_9ZZZZ